jgi:hypothetical protein
MPITLTMPDAVMMPFLPLMLPLMSILMPVLSDGRGAGPGRLASCSRLNGPARSKAAITLHVAASRRRF